MTSYCHVCQTSPLVVSVEASRLKMEWMLPEISNLKEYKVIASRVTVLFP